MTGNATGESESGASGGGIVFVAIFLGPFVGGGAVAIAHVVSGIPAWAPIGGLALVHWVLVSLFCRRSGSGAGAAVLWSLAAVIADTMWYGVMLTLAAALAGTAGA